MKSQSRVLRRTFLEVARATATTAVLAVCFGVGCSQLSSSFDGKMYGVPTSGVQPVLFMYNKDIFKQYNLNAPQTWDELLKAVTTLKAHNVIPIALAGSSKWPYLMWAEYLTDRIGGPEAFN